jgi:hypothetical protein
VTLPPFGSFDEPPVDWVDCHNDWLPCQRTMTRRSIAPGAAPSGAGDDADEDDGFGPFVAVDVALVARDDGALPGAQDLGPDLQGRGQTSGDDVVDLLGAGPVGLGVVAAPGGEGPAPATARCSLATNAPAGSSRSSGAAAANTPPSWRTGRPAPGGRVEPGRRLARQTTGLVGRRKSPENGRRRAAAAGPNEEEAEDDHG